jgi:hypothetical protein
MVDGVGVCSAEVEKSVLKVIKKRRITPVEAVSATLAVLRLPHSLHLNPEYA